ncbi:MAG: response regulator [Bacteroidales bacterium]|nr:response regulator [Bacteroidales bacterium]
MTDLSDKTIFLVDDDKDFCFLIKMMLKKTKVKLLFAYNGEEAIQFMDKQATQGIDIDLILLDIQMPLISGYTVIDLFKKRYPELPVMAVTAFGMIGEREKCIQSGFDEYLSKPFEESDLVILINRLLNPES